jgi:uncharacterized repeat protein (TIGR03943 family)
VNRSAQGMVLLLLGGAALRAGLTDLHLRYVKEVLQPFLVAASAVLVVAGAVTLWYEWRRREPQQDGHGHGHREPRIGWLLVAPVLGLLLVAPPALGSYTASTAGAVSPEEVTAFPPLPEELDPVPLTVLDYVARALWDDQGSLDGRRVQLTGFLIADDDSEVYLARLVLSCCAADARPIKVGLAGNLRDYRFVDRTGATVTVWVNPA